MSKKIHENDDHLVAEIVSKFRHDFQYYPTLTKITACYNIMSGLLAVCSVCGDEKSLVKLANDFHEGLLDQIDNLYKEPIEE